MTLSAFLCSWLRPAGYEATVTFAATQSKIGDGGGQFQPNTAAFRPMVESMTVAEEVIRDLGLDKAPYGMTPSTFLDSLGVTEIRGTSLMSVKVTMGDPALAARVANAVADRAVAAARRVSASEATYARDLIKAEVDVARHTVEETEARLRDYRKASRVEAVRKDVETRLGGPQSPVLWPLKPPSNSPTVMMSQDHDGGRPGVVELSVKIAAEEARVESLEKDLAARRARGANPDGLEAQVSSARSEVAALRRQRAEMLADHTVDAGLQRALDKLYTIEAELARLQVEQTVAERTYGDLTQKYQEARLQVIGKSSEFVVIDPARPSDRPASKHALRNAVVALVTWLCLALAGVLAWDAISRRRVTA